MSNFKFIEIHNSTVLNLTGQKKWSIHKLFKGRIIKMHPILNLILFDKVVPTQYTSVYYVIRDIYPHYPPTFGSATDQKQEKNLWILIIGIYLNLLLVNYITLFVIIFLQ